MLRPTLFAMLVLAAASPMHAQDVKVKLKLESTFLGHRSAAFSPDGKHVAACTADNTVTMWNLTSKSGSTVFSGHKDTVNDLAFSPDGQWLATGSNDETVRLWDAATGKAKDKFQVGTTASEEFNGSYAVFAVAFHPESTLLASAGRDGAVHLWDPKTGKKKKTLTQERKINSVAFNNTGEFLATGDIDGAVTVWNVLTGKEKTTFSHKKSVFSVAFSNDGQWLASSGVSIYGHLWSAVDWKSSGTPFEHKERVRSIAFSPDSQMVATGSEDGSFSLWQVSTRKHLTTITGQTTHCVTFSPDGKLLATVGVEKLGAPHMVRVWQITGAPASP